MISRPFDSGNKNKKRKNTAEEIDSIRDAKTARYDNPSHRSQPNENTDTLPSPSGTVQSSSSAVMVEGAKEVVIHDGKFQQTMGNHTNLVINITNRKLGHVEHPSSSKKEEFSPEALEQALDMSINNIHNFLAAAIPTTRESTLDVTQRHEDDQTMVTSRTMINVMENANVIYQRHLQAKGRGFPLWIPEPNRRLPLAYRKEGISIGDVGIITPSGGFSFLFNICLPANHPINPPILPEGFSPIHPAITELDTLDFREFKSNSFVASTSIEESWNDKSSGGIVFQTSASEGAILTMPDGAIAHDLENIARMRMYAIENIESWYRYVNGARGREAKNGDVRLVIGCDKTSSWGMAAIANSGKDSTSYLKFCPVPKGELSNATSTVEHSWEHSGMAESKIGPDPEDIREMHEEETQTDGPPSRSAPSRHKNQCLFMRTLNIMLNASQWAALTRDLTAESVQNSSKSSTKSFGAGTQNFAAHEDTSSGVKFQGPIEGSSHDNDSSSSQRSMTSMVSDREAISTFLYPANGNYHPSNNLNAVLLDMIPSAKMVATCDQDWYSIFTQEVQSTLTRSQIYEKATTNYYIREQEGIVFLEPKVQPLSFVYDAPGEYSIWHRYILASDADVKPEHESLNPQSAVSRKLANLSRNKLLFGEPKMGQPAVHRLATSSNRYTELLLGDLQAGEHTTSESNSIGSPYMTSVEESQKPFPTTRHATSSTSPSKADSTRSSWLARSRQVRFERGQK